MFAYERAVKVIRGLPRWDLTGYFGKRTCVRDGTRYGDFTLCCQKGKLKHLPHVPLQLGKGGPAVTACFSQSHPYPIRTELPTYIFR